MRLPRSQSKRENPRDSPSVETRSAARNADAATIPHAAFIETPPALADSRLSIDARTSSGASKLPEKQLMPAPKTALRAPPPTCSSVSIPPIFPPRFE